MAVEFQSVRNVLEIINFAAAPVIAVLAWRGLKQIQVTREVARATAQRESFRLATERTERFANEIIPMMMEFDRLLKDGKLPDFKRVKITETGHQISVDWKDAPKWLEEVDANGPAVWGLANSLEGFAMWFTCQIADEKIAFRPCGVTYCQGVQKVLPLIVFMNSKDKLFTHTLRLYHTWKDKIAMEKNLAQQTLLENERKSLKVENITPIGT